jgi:hypothetical protein
MSTLNTSITYNNDRDKSFGLLRTNPKLTTNVKIVVDSNDDIFLSSFSATKQLSSNTFKRFKLDGRGTYSMDLSRFYGSVPMSERFEVMRKFSDISTHHEYSKQFENQYNYGAEFNITKLYDEQYKFLAPIWLNTAIPSNFVVYRVETTSPRNIQNPNSYLGQNEKIMDMLSNATIVANFDLSRKSKIGEYIRNHIEDATMPSAGLSFDFDTEEPCEYMGIDVKYGGFTSKEEYLADDYIRKDDLEIYKNELLTGGFERNGLAFSNILNLEFMFDDTTAEKYKTYRYFGLYVDSIKEGDLKLSSITSDYLLFNEASSVYDLSGFSGAITEPEIYMVPGNEELSLPTLNYIKDKHYNLYHIKNKSQGSSDNKINLSIPDLDAFKGYSEKHGTLTIDQKTRSFKSFIKLRLNEAPNHLDRFFIGNRHSIEEDSYNMGAYTYLADSSLDAGQYSGNSFSNQGTLSQIVMAISGVINNGIDEGRVNVTPSAESIIIESYVVGEDRNMMMFGVYDNNFTNFIQITTSRQDDMGLNSASGTITFTDWDIHTLRGGAGENQGMLIKSSEHGDVAIGDYIKEKDLESYVKIIDIVRDFNGKDYRVILKKPAALSNNGTLKLYNKFNAEFGKLSAYDLKDLCFDFHDEDISGLGSLEFDLGFGLYETKGSMARYNYDSGTFSWEEDPIVPVDLQGLNKDRFRGLIDNVLGSDPVGEIANIYGRLKENELKETAILSRIVPHINTFVRKDSSNIRGNDYILNVNESMGISNMSPVLGARRSDYRFMNLEHYTMGQLPKLQAAVRNRDIYVPGSESMANADFLLGITPWTVIEDSGVPRGTITHDATSPSFMRLVYSASGTSGHALKISSTDPPSIEYAFKVTMRVRGTLADGTTDQGGVFHSIGELGDLGNVISNPPLTAAWQNYEFHIVLAPGASTTFRVYLDGAVAGDIVDFDSISIRILNKMDLMPNNIDRGLYNIDDSLIFAYDDTSTDYIGSTGFTGQFDETKAKDVTFDYFSLFESFNGYFNYITSDITLWPTNPPNTEVWEDMKKVNHSDIIRRGSVFSKGVNYKFSENLDGYRFMNILRYEHSADTSETTIEVVKNEKWETLVIFTTIKTKENIIPEFGLTKGHMYSVDDITTYSTVNDSDNLISSSLGYANFASLNPSIPIALGFYGDTNNPTYTEVPLDLVDTPIKATFDYGGSAWPPITSPGDSFILNASQESIDAGDAQFNSQINKNDVGEYSYIIFTDASSVRYAAKILDVISDTSLLIDGYPLGPVTGTFVIPTTRYTAMPSHQHDDFDLTLHEGGLNGFRGLFDNICIGSVAKRFGNDSGVSYTTVDPAGDETEKGPRVKIIRPHSVVKPSEKRAIGDTDKPNAFAVTTGSVGYDIANKEIKYLTKLNRHSGEYNPAVKDIITFDSIYNKHKLNYSAMSDSERRELKIYGKFNGHGIAFESYKNCIEDYGIIKNFYYHKVNENTELDIIKLSESSDKLPLYPLIGEIAIDKTDLNILDSKYSDSFFKRGLIGSNNENAHGTKSAEEVKAFMASTIMKVDDIYNIDVFYKGKLANSLNDLNVIYEDELNTESIHFFEDEYRIFADFYVTDALREALIADGILSKFSANVAADNSYGDTTTLDDDIAEYVKHNIVNRYIIDSIDVYVNESKDIDTGFSSDVSQLDDYKKSVSHSLESFNDKEIGFRLIFEKRLGYNYDFKLNIKIKA